MKESLAKQCSLDILKLCPELYLPSVKIMLLNRVSEIYTARSNLRRCCYDVIYQYVTQKHPEYEYSMHEYSSLEIYHILGINAIDVKLYYDARIKYTASNPKTTLLVEVYFKSATTAKEFIQYVKDKITRRSRYKTKPTNLKTKVNITTVEHILELYPALKSQEVRLLILKQIILLLKRQKDENFGICYCISRIVYKYIFDNTTYHTISNISIATNVYRQIQTDILKIHECDAIEHFEAIKNPNNGYWWRLRDVDSRIRFLTWVIEKTEQELKQSEIC